MTATTTQTIYIISCPACGNPIELHATYDVRLDLDADASVFDRTVTATLMMTGARVNHECPPKPSPRNPFTSGGLTIDIGNVRTVGDLTARHVGRRVRLDDYYDAKLETIFAHDGGEVSLNFTHPEGFTFGCSRFPDTPCEVLS